VACGDVCVPSLKNGNIVLACQVSARIQWRWWVLAVFLCGHSVSLPPAPACTCSGLGRHMCPSAGGGSQQQL
jgi:hypothetical protein